MQRPYNRNSRSRRIRRPIPNHLRISAKRVVLWWRTCTSWPNRSDDPQPSLLSRCRITATRIVHRPGVVGPGMTDGEVDRSGICRSQVADSSSVPSRQFSVAIFYEGHTVHIVRGPSDRGRSGCLCAQRLDGRYGQSRADLMAVDRSRFLPHARRRDARIPAPEADRHRPWLPIELS